jgi:hypothetical protein
MVICRRRRRTLREIERYLAASDPRLDDFFLSFTARTQGCTMPRAERILPWPFRALTRLWRGRSMRDRVSDGRAENRIDP